MVVFIDLRKYIQSVERPMGLGLDCGGVGEECGPDFNPNIIRCFFLLAMTLNILKNNGRNVAQNCWHFWATADY